MPDLNGPIQAPPRRTIPFPNAAARSRWTLSVLSRPVYAALARARADCRSADSAETESALLTAIPRKPSTKPPLCDDLRLLCCADRIGSETNFRGLHRLSRPRRRLCLRQLLSHLTRPKSPSCPVPFASGVRVLSAIRLNRPAPRWPLTNSRRSDR